MTHSQAPDGGEPALATTAGARVVTDLGAELTDLAQSARRAAERETRAARFWRRTHLALGLPTAVLAAAAAVAGLATTAGRIPAAIVAMVVACLSAASTFLGSEARAHAAEQRASAWEVLARDARVAAFPNGVGGTERDDGEKVLSALNTMTARQGAIIRGDLDSALSIRERTLGIRGVQERDWELTTPKWGGAVPLPYLGGGGTSSPPFGGGIASSPPSGIASSPPSGGTSSPSFGGTSSPPFGGGDWLPPSAGAVPPPSFGGGDRSSPFLEDGDAPLPYLGGGKPAATDRPTGQPGGGGDTGQPRGPGGSAPSGPHA